MAKDSGGSEQPHKAHRDHKSGASAKKKDKKNKNKGGDGSEKRQNPKAFAFTSSTKAKRLQSRSAEIEQKKLHMPVMDRSIGEPPPFVVVVQGPPQVGKSLLIKCLVKHYTKHNLHEVRGPITVVSGKHRRVQFIECPNDINGMIDAAKIADLALLLIDGSYGFEMETFEFLNIMQVHGFPKVMGVLTHLDGFKDVKKLRKTKQRLKHRFWAEIMHGAKLFYLSGLIHGKYVKREVHNLARFISVIKPNPLSWRLAHPYLLTDRFEDVTPPDQVRVNKKCDRNVILYGYLRGCNMKKGSKVHISGVGDFNVAGMSSLADPCPLPSSAKKRGLRDKEKLFYAPMSGLGELLYDKDAVYININDHFVQFSKPEGETNKDNDVGVTLVKTLQNTKYSVDERLEQSFLNIFSRKPPVLSGNEKKELEDKPPALSGNNTDNEKKELEDQNQDDDESGALTEFTNERKYETDDEESSDDDEEKKERESERDEKKYELKEVVESHGGRMRRKALSSNFNDQVETEEGSDDDESENEEQLADASDQEDEDEESEDESEDQNQDNDEINEIGALTESTNEGKYDRDEESSDDEERREEESDQDEKKYELKEGSDDDGESENEEHLSDASDHSEEEEEKQEEDNSENENENSSKWKESLITRTLAKKNVNLMQLVYGQTGSNQDKNSSEMHDNSESEGSDDEEFFQPKGKGSKAANEISSLDDINSEDCSKFLKSELRDWSEQELIQSIRDRFVTGDWSKASKRGQETNDGDYVNDDEDEEEEYDYIEDLETGKMVKPDLERGKNDEEEKEEEERRLKKLALRAEFNAKYPFNRYYFCL
ncbi:hypothetical protein LUZ60_013150 [Juncus effusus]|nr:hypothetical protein LUZ60_013150 [Juncus effusus]